jgi:hypothetical protein
MFTLAGKPRRVQTVALVVVVAWLPYASTRCLEAPGPHGATESVNCIFGHHGAAEPHSDRHDAAARHPHRHDAASAHRQAGSGHDHDTCCTRTGKFAVTLTSTPPPPDPSAAVALIARAELMQLPIAPFLDRRRCLVPLAHAPPVYLRNASLLI